jgi:hypothetical protein
LNELKSDAVFYLKRSLHVYQNEAKDKDMAIRMESDVIDL